MLLQWSITKTSAGWETENAAIDAPFNYLPSASELQTCGLTAFVCLLWLLWDSKWKHFFAAYFPSSCGTLKTPDLNPVSLPYSFVFCRWIICSSSHWSLLLLPPVSAQAGKRSTFHHGCQTNPAPLWPSALPLPHRGQLQPGPLLHLRQRALGQERRAPPQRRQGALEPERLALVPLLAGDESGPRRLRCPPAGGEEEEGREVQAENEPARQRESRRGRSRHSWAGRFRLSAFRDPEVQPGRGFGHAEEHLRSVHSLRQAGDLQDQRRSGWLLWADILAARHGNARLSYFKDQTVMERRSSTQFSP